MVSRAQRTPIGEWWWTVDRLMLAAIGALMLAGVVLSLAASPPVAGRLGLEPFYFVNRHILFLIPTIAIFLAASFLNPRQIRRLAIIVFAGGRQVGPGAVLFRQPPHPVPDPDHRHLSGGVFSQPAPDPPPGDHRVR